MMKKISKLDTSNTLAFFHQIFKASFKHDISAKRHKITLTNNLVNSKTMNDIPLYSDINESELTFVNKNKPINNVIIEK